LNVIAVCRYFLNCNTHAVKSHQKTVSISKSGYLYVYCSNESNVDVFFDNLQVIHTRGPLLESTDYYPFGLTMAGISSKAAGIMGNKYEYNGIEHDNDLDLNIDEAFYRNLDPTIGRWWQIDPKIEMGYENISPYSSMHNNPILVSDPLGDFDDYKLKQDGHIEFLNETKDKTDKLYATDKNGDVIKDKSITVEKEIINNVMNNPPTGTNPNGSSTLGTISNKSVAVKLFEFLANNSEVEWGRISIGQQATGPRIQDTRITTSHDKEGNKSLNSLVDKYLEEAGESGRLILEVTHSHPRTPGYFVDFPSGV